MSFTIKLNNLNFAQLKVNILVDFNSFLTYISDLKEFPLGGLQSQFKMAPEMRKRFSDKDVLMQHPKESAVLALLYPDKENFTKLLLMERASYNGIHSSQISFPGGKKDQKDPDLLFTALRETEEEVGVQKDTVEIIRELTKTYIPPSNFLVTPFIGYVTEPVIFTTNNEVENLLEIHVSDLLSDDSLHIKKMTTSYMKEIDVPCFKLNNYIVWGATAMMLSEIKDLLKSVI